jgi:hypothetical protein
MEHTVSKVKVYESSEYSRFSIIDANRDINQKKVDKILADIKNGTDVLKYCPIYVYERQGKLEINDGQHRFWVSKTLKRPVYYIVMEHTLHIAEMAAVNSNSSGWATKDFLKAYNVMDNPHYKKLHDFMDRYTLSPTLSIKLLTMGHAGSSPGGLDNMDNFKRGKFEIKFWDEAVELAEIGEKFTGFKGWKSQAFFIALEKIKKAGRVKMQDLAAKVSKNIDKLTLQEGWKQYIETLESIYNSKRTDRVIIWDNNLK